MNISERGSQKRQDQLKNARSFFFYWVAVALCSLFSSQLCAESTSYFEENLPVQTLALAVIPDCQSLQQTALKTPIGKLWKHPQLTPLWDEIQSQWGTDALFQSNSEFAFLNIPALQKKVTSVFLAFVSEPGFTNVFLPELKVSPVLGLKMGRETSAMTNLLHTMASSEIFSSHMKLESDEKSQSIGIPLSTQQAKAFLSFLDIFSIPHHLNEDTPVTFWISALDSYLLVELNTPQASNLILQAARAQSPRLSEHSEWEKHREHLQNATFWSWAYLSPIIQSWIERESAEIDKIARTSEEKDAKDPPQSTPSFEDKEMLLPMVVGKLGLESFLSASITILDTPAGVCTDYFISSPEASRQGIAKIISLEPGDCSPPAFVSRDVLSFSRIRLNFSSAWDAIEKMVDEIMPDVRDLLAEALLPSILEEDPNFKFKENFISPLGNDLTICQSLVPNGEKEVIRFIQIADGKKYIQTVKKLIEILAPIPILEKDVARHKVTSIPLPDLEVGTADYKTNYYHLTFKEGVLAFSTDYKLVENFLTSSEKNEKLARLPQLQAAAQSIGAFSSGFFEYTDSKATAENYYKKLRKFLEHDQTRSFVVPVFTFLAQDINVNLGFVKNLVSPSLLPEFDSFSDCFDFSLSAFQSRPDGFTLRTILPVTEGPQSPDSTAQSMAPTETPEQISQSEEADISEVVESPPAEPQIHEPELMDPLPAGPDPTDPLPALEHPFAS